MNLQKIWDIGIYQSSKGFRVRLRGMGQFAEGRGGTIEQAFRGAECKLIYKPPLFAYSTQPESETEDSHK